MKFFVVEPFTLETPQGKVTLPAGKILELSQDQAARLLQAGFIAEVQSLAEMEQEYFTLLARWWKLDTDPDAMTMDQVRQLVERLDVLYRALRGNGRNPPVRLPVERKKVA